MITKRGKPDKGDPVHAKLPDPHGEWDNEPLCRSGSWHLFLTDSPEEVNCPACLERRPSTKEKP